MAKMYADLCEQGLRTCIDVEGIVAVPVRWLQATIDELKARGREDLVPKEE